MPFVPLFESDLVIKIHENLKTIIQENEVEILKWANGGVAMKPFAKYRKSQWYNTLFPVISLIPLWTDENRVPDDSRLETTHKFEVLFEDAGADADEASDSVVKRAKAVAALFHKQTKQTVLAGRDMTKVGAFHMDISRVEYFPVPRGTTMYLQLSSFTVTINVIESRK